MQRRRLASPLPYLQSCQENPGMPAPSQSVISPTAFFLGGGGCREPPPHRPCLETIEQKLFQTAGAPNFAAAEPPVPRCQTPAGRSARAGGVWLPSRPLPLDLDRSPGGEGRGGDLPEPPSGRPTHRASFAPGCCLCVPGRARPPRYLQSKTALLHPGRKSPGLVGRRRRGTRVDLSAGLLGGGWGGCLPPPGGRGWGGGCSVLCADRLPPPAASPLRARVNASLRPLQGKAMQGAADAGRSSLPPLAPLPDAGGSRARRREGGGKGPGPPDWLLGQPRAPLIGRRPRRRISRSLFSFRLQRTV